MQIGVQGMTVAALDASLRLDPEGASPVEADTPDPDTIPLANLFERQGISNA